MSNSSSSTTKSDFLLKGTKIFQNKIPISSSSQSDFLLNGIKIFKKTSNSSSIPKLKAYYHLINHLLKPEQEIGLQYNDCMYIPHAWNIYKN